MRELCENVDVEVIDTCVCEVCCYLRNTQRTMFVKRSVIIGHSVCATRKISKRV